LKTVIESRHSRGVTAPRTPWWISRAAAAAIAAILFLQPAGIAADTPPDNPAPDLIMQVMTGELKRATTGLAKADPAPYYTAYTIYDQTAIWSALMARCSQIPAFIAARPISPPASARRLSITRTDKRGKAE